MSEYKNVEKPFLEKLKNLNWRIIDQGDYGIPQDPVESLRTSFKEVTLKQEFIKAVKKINIIDGEEWLTDKQLEDLYNGTIANEKGNLSLLEANRKVFEKLIGITKTTVAKNEITGEENPLVKLIDFKNWDENEFIAINQFRIVTPGGPREGIIPDIVLFVNGLPFTVIECKDVDVADPISSAVEQIMRYANTRGDDFGFKEGEERLFHYNLFSIATHGEEARIGSITGDFEYYLNWKDIFPNVYKNIEIISYAVEEKARYQNNGLYNDPRVRQEVLIKGILNKEILLDILQHFTLFMELKEGVEVKIVCRYQQYRAVGKILD
jgi:type I restriction enzyme R subunit